MISNYSEEQQNSKMVTMKRIALAVTQSSWGGAQRYIYDLAISFKEQGHFVTVIAGQDKDPILLNRLRDKQIDAIVVPSLIRSINPFVDLVCLIKLFFIFRRHRFDVIHLNSSKAGVLGSVAAWLAGTPCVAYTAHGFVFNERLSSVTKHFYILVERFGSLFRDVIIAVSEFDHQSALRYHIASKGKLRTVWNGIDVTHDTYVDRAEARRYLLGNTSADLKGKFLIGCVANFYTNKGLAYLISAMRLVVRKYPQTMLIIVGEGSLRPLLERQIDDLGLSQHIVLTGYRKDPEKYLKAFDVLVSASLKEGLPYTLLEAARARIPIIATAVGGTPEILFHEVHGLLVPPADTQALAGAIAFVIENPEKINTYVIQAHERVTKEFDIERMASATLNSYEECIRDNKLT